MPAFATTKPATTVKDVPTRIDLGFGEPEPRRTLSESVTARLRKLIVTGHLPPGTPLRLTSVAVQLGVSPMPVREALRALESEGLVDFEAHRGATVSRLSIEDVEELYAIRMGLEALAARVAVERMTDRAARKIHREFVALERLQHGEDTLPFMAQDHAFHRSLYEASGRARLVRRIEEQWDSSQRAGPLVFRAWRPLSIALDAHRPILKAVEARDAERAERLTREHLVEASLRVLAALREAESRPSE